MKLTLGHVAYHWGADEKWAHYRGAAKSDAIDTVYLGEVVCSKRAPFFEKELPEVMQHLDKAGKNIVLSSLAEVMLVRERKAMEALAEIDWPEVEINNAAGLLALQGKPHRIGPFMNAYNEATIDWMVSQGATHITLPAELPAKSIEVAARCCNDLGVGIEVQVFGRASLAVSARCYHARAHQRTKDSCQFICEQDPDGMPLTTMDKQNILRINGIQTMSESYVSLLAELGALKDMGVTHARLMPQAVDMPAVADVFADMLAGKLTLGEAEEKMADICQGTGFSNGFYHGEAGYKRIAAQAASF